MKSGIAAAAFLALTVRGLAFDFEPVKPLDTKAVDQAMLKDVFGDYEIRGKGGKRCRITLSKEMAIGGMAVTVAPGCDKAFPVMADIAGWRLLEGWTIDLIDPLRKTVIRFQTPDERYIAFGDPAKIAGMDELRKLPDSSANKRQ